VSKGKCSEACRNVFAFSGPCIFLVAKLVYICREEKKAAVAAEFERREALMDTEYSAGMPLLFACAGGSSVGQIANDACRELAREGVGKLYCLSGIGGHVGGIVETAKTTETLVAVDGCGVRCALKSLEAAGVKASHHIVLTDFGVEKNANLFPATADIQSAKEKIRESFQR
jgi:uncharacterized metal-binding protein